MAIGPFLSYVPPGVYTQTLTEANAAGLFAGVRLPFIIGVGQEELSQSDVEIVRGSSATVDQQIVNEDISLAWVVDATNPNHLILGEQDGTRTTFRVRNYPIVDGQGFGRVTNDTRTVTVTVNSVPVAVGAVNGTKGTVTLQVPTQPTDVVRCTYYFHRGDTSFVDDVSEQVTATQATLTCPGFAPFAFLAGSTDTLKFKVNGTEYSVVFPTGSYSAAAAKSVIDQALITNLSVAVYTDNEGKDHITLVSTQSLEITDGSANGPFAWSTGTKTARQSVFQVFNRPIVDGSGGGVTTTDPSKVVAKVNNVQVVVSAVDGANGLVSLPYAPAMGSTVVITYWANTWQDTFDYLPNTLITSVTRCGISPGRADYISGVDFVVSNPSSDVSIIHWGASYSISAASTTTGAEPFDNSQVTGLLVDDKMYLGSCDRVVDNTVIPALVSPTEFLLPEIPTLGNGRDTTLGTSTYNSVSNSRQGVTSNRPDLVAVYVGRNLADALNRAAAKVITVDGATRKVTLKDPVPPDYNAYATFYYNRLTDNTYLLTCKTPGSVGIGQYEVLDTNQSKSLYQVRFGTKTGISQTIQWPRGVETIPDAFHTGAGAAVSEIVTVTFSDALARNAVYTNKGASPYSFYSPYSATWITKLNGVNYSTNLVTARKAHIISGHVTPIQTGPDTGKITVSVGSETLNVSVDGTAYPVTLTTGNRTAAQICTDINTAVGSAVATSVQIGPVTGDIIFLIASVATPAALPAGFDTVSNVQILQGTAEATLGFRTFQSANGTPGAINKPATLLGTLAGPFNITTGLNDQLKIQVDGIDYIITLPGGAAVTPAAVVAAIVAVPGLTSVASVGTGPNLDMIRLTSQINDARSSVLIQDGNANAVLGFNQNDQASQTLVTAQEVVNALLETAAFVTAGVAYPAVIDGSTYITIESLTVGLTASSVAFVTSANTAFNTSTGVSITPGTDGDVGEDAYQQFTVTSNNVYGSTGTGRPGQTFTANATGLRFTVLPAQTGDYTDLGYFTMTVSPTFQVDPARPFYAIPGLETTVSNTVGVPVADKGQVQTYNPGGVETKVGDFYYISYRYMKQDFTTRIYRQLKTIEANYGKVSAENRATLGAYLAILNGALLVGIKQVLKVPNTNQASDADFNAAIDELATPLPGGIKPDILVPLSNGVSVYTHLTSHCEIQSNIRNQSERMGMIGFAGGTIPTVVQAIVQGLNSNRIVAFYPDSAVITLTDELGQNFEQLVDGSFFAAAVSGAVVSPAVDVATPYDRRRIQGFTRIPRILDPIEANQTAVKGVTILEDLEPIIRIRHGLTTNMANVLTRTPTVTQIADYVQQRSRETLDSFVGSKFLAGRAKEVKTSLTTLLKALKEAEIITAYTGINAGVDAADPTILRVESFYSPIFPLLYLVLTFNVRARLT
jgi:hypothetical protein